MRSNNNFLTSKYFVMAAGALFVFTQMAEPVAAERQNIFVYFGSCMNGQQCKPGAECCIFDNQRDIRDVQFCMTDEQKGGDWKGLYVDNDLTYWKWTCEKPPDEPEEDDSPPVEKETELEPLEPPPCSNYEDKMMEWILWTTYLSGEAWIFGYVVMMPLGVGVYAWHALNALLIMGQCEFNDWLAGPFLRGYVTGPFIYTMAIYLTIIPGVNFVSSFLLGWWANLDYYGYNYELFAGPTLPTA